MAAAVSFLTVVPMPPPRDSGIRLGRPWFPLVGGGIGAIAGGAAWGASRLAGSGVGAVCAMGCLALLSGGLHLDGLMDSADGLLGGTSREQRLQIMRDPHAGAFGVIAVVLVLLGQFSTMSSLVPARLVVGLAAAAAIARWCALGVLLALPYARSDGLGVAWSGGHRVLDAMIGTLLAAPFVWLGGVRALLGVGLAGVGALAVSLLALRRVGGATGDVYGAVVETSQLLVLVALVVGL